MLEAIISNMFYPIRETHWLGDHEFAKDGPINQRKVKYQS